MSKWPFTLREVDGVQRKVFTITCAETGVEFEHVQMGRGRPPVYAPGVRAQRAEPAVRKGRTPSVLKVEVSEDTPEPGDVVMRLTHGMKRDAALRWLTPSVLVSVDGDNAVVERKGERLTTKFSNLVKLNFN